MKQEAIVFRSLPLGVFVFGSGAHSDSVAVTLAVAVHIIVLVYPLATASCLGAIIWLGADVTVLAYSHPQYVR